MTREASLISGTEALRTPADLHGHGHNCAVPSPQQPRQFPQLPAGFRLGTTTASYQIEGAATEDGKGPSIWDTFCAQEGRIADGSSGEVACDHYHRFAEDVALMKRLGAGGYRFSLSWPRIQPNGAGAPNEKGLDFYDRLIDCLLDNGVQPMVTLHHWDLPQALEDDGGWLNRSTVDRFADFAAIVGERYADRVEHWIPVNEPNVVTMLGYATGTHAPGRTLLFDALPVAHHLLLGPRPCRDRAPRRRARPASAAPTTTPPCGRPATTRPTSARPSSSTHSGTACTSSRCCSAATRST